MPITTLIIPPPKYSLALLPIVLTDVSPTCFTARPQPGLWDYRESVKILDFSGLTQLRRLHLWHECMLEEEASHAPSAPTGNRHLRGPTRTQRPSRK